MESKIRDLLETMELLERVEQFEDMEQAELRELAVELVKIDTIRSSGKGISNAIKYINYPNM